MRKICIRKSAFRGLVAEAKLNKLEKVIDFIDVEDVGHLGSPVLG